MLSEDYYIPYAASARIGRGRALFFAPHPDDEVLGCTGALLQHLADHDPVRVIVATDGGWGHGGDYGGYTQKRREESCSAAALLGYPPPIFWGLPDRGLAADSTLDLRVLEALDDFCPDWVYAPSWWEVHPDHRALSRAVTLALRGRLQATLVLYEVGVPLHPNRLLDLTAVLALKRCALSVFKSQLKNQAYDHQMLGLNAFRAYTLPRSMVAAEAYRVVESAALPAGDLCLPQVLRCR